MALKIFRRLLLAVVVETAAKIVAGIANDGVIEMDDKDASPHPEGKKSSPFWPKPLLAFNNRCSDLNRQVDECRRNEIIDS